jgi:hypothetical protein
MAMPETVEWAKSRKYLLITYTDGREVKQKAVTGQVRSLSIELRHIPDNCVADTLDLLIQRKYLLMRTKALLPGIIRLPEAIASLVQDAHSEDDQTIHLDASLLEPSG